VAAESASSYYHPASWQSTPVTDSPAVEPTTNSSEPIRFSSDTDTPTDNKYQDAFTEPSPVEGLTGSDDWDKPVADVDDKEFYDKDVYETGYDYKGGKGGSCWCPCWRFTIDGLVMRREHMDTVPLVVDSATGATLLDADDIGLSHRGGLRLSAARQIFNPCNDIEFEFFWIDQWSAFATTDIPGAQITMYGANFGTSPLTLGYGNDLYSVELNWRRAWGYGRIKTLLGLRFMEIDENASVLDAGSLPPLFLGDIDNHLIGLQIGVEGILYQSCRWEIEGGCKMGVYANSADFDAAFPQAGPAATFHAADDHTSFAAELWLGANYCVTDRLSLRAGYQALWIEGVAVLPEQLDDLAVPLVGDLDMGGSPFYHGLYFGAQFDW
jgi:hypothetical protein